MVFELLHAPFPDGYTEALLPLDQCKQHLSIGGSLPIAEDGLIGILRDAAIEFVERYCSVRLGPLTDMVWRAEGFPCSSRQALSLGVSPVTQITAISWRDSAGAAVNGVVGDFRVSSRGEVLPAVSGCWPGDVGGAVEITFDAGHAANAAPASLLQAARMFLAHLWMNREAVIVGAVAEEAPFGVRALCAPYRRVGI